MNVAEVDPSLGAEQADRALWARQIISSRRSRGKSVPAQIDLETAILDIDCTDTTKGSSTVEITIFDEDWQLMDGGFFDADGNGRLDPIDVNYPDGTKYWWRVTQVEPDWGAQTVLMTFMERAAVYLMHHHGPLKMSRARATRAEFLQHAFGQVKAGGGIRFHSHDLHRHQPIEHVKTDKARRENKSQGINPDATVNIQGVQATTDQLREVETALDVAMSLPRVPELAVLAMLVAGIMESNFRPIRNLLGSGYWGVFQASPSEFDVTDTAGMARSFLLGGKGFQAGGAIALANAHPDYTPGRIAQNVEASDKPPSWYEHQPSFDPLDEAKKLLASYGGASFGGTTYMKQYNFEIGTPTDPREDFWAGGQRLADEVGWPLFLDGNDAYFDPETTLIRQRPTCVVKRGDAAVKNLRGPWDERDIATEVELELACEPFEFRAGEVMVLEGFGPYSTGSTVGLPGHWLIAEWTRKPMELYTTFTLRQPTKPKPEPASEVMERTDPSSAGTGDISGTPKQIIDTVVIPIALACGVEYNALGERLSPLTVEHANSTHGSTVGGSRSDHQGPPAAAWAADMSNGQSPTPQMDRLASALGQRFGIPWSGSGLKTQNVTTPDGSVYRCQLIYRTNEGGNHFNHVHFGIRLVKTGSGLGNLGSSGGAWNDTGAPGGG